MPVQYSADEIREKYDALAPRYDRAEWLAEVAGFSRLRRRLFSQASGDVLEVAVGTGLNLPFYPSECRVTGIDLSPEMLAIARARASQLGRAATFRVMDAASLEFPDASFDTVTSSLSSCTFPDPIAALREMCRVCRPGGRVLLLEHGRSRSGWIGRLQDRLAEGYARRAGCHWNREPHLLAREANLDIVRDQRHLFGIVHLIEARPARRSSA